MSVGLYCKPLGAEFLSPRKKDMQKVKRQLFGPVDHEANQRFVSQELEKHITLKSERWNFDFVRETTLSPNGIYEWVPVSPVKIIRSLKRKPTSFEVDNIDLYCLPEDIRRQKTHEHDTQKNIHKTQSLITDFMQIKKNSTTETSKKLMPRPSKIARLGNELKS